MEETEVVKNVNENWEGDEKKEKSRYINLLEKICKDVNIEESDKIIEEFTRNKN